MILQHPSTTGPCLERAFYRLNWDGERPNYLWFVNLIDLDANSVRKIKQMLQELSPRSTEVVLKITASKTEVMKSSGLPKASLGVDGFNLKVDIFCIRKKYAP